MSTQQCQRAKSAQTHRTTHMCPFIHTNTQFLYLKMTQVKCRDLAHIRNSRAVSQLPAPLCRLILSPPEESWCCLTRCNIYYCVTARKAPNQLLCLNLSKHCTSDMSRTKGDTFLKADFKLHLLIFLDT